MPGGKENLEKGKAKVLRLVPGRPLQNCTGSILNVPHIEAPVATNNEAGSMVVGSPGPYSDEDPEDTCQSSKPPTGYLDDLFEDLEVPLIDSETLADKLNRVLENQKTLFSNQKVIFSFMSQLVSSVSNISKCLSGMGVSFSVGEQEGGLGEDYSVGGEGQELSSSLPLGSRQEISAGRDKGGYVNDNHSPSVSTGSGVDFSLGREEGRLVHQDHSPSLSLSSGLDFSVGRDEGGLESSLNFSSGLGLGDTVQQCSGEQGGDGFLLEAMKIKSSSCSMGNFAVKLVQKFFAPDQLVNRNCRGSRGKEGLDPVKLAAVKKYTFKFFPTPVGFKDQKWGKCIIAIDEFLRRKRKDIVATERGD